MTKGPSKEIERAGFGVTFAAFAAVFAASLINLLHFQAYPLVRAEVALLLAVAGAVAAVLAGLTARAGSVGQAVMAGLLALLAADLNSDAFWIAAVAGAAGMGAAWRWGGGAVMRFSAIAAAVVTATALIGLGGRSEPVRASGPVARGGGQGPLIVHLILDEQAGQAGMVGGKALAERYAGMDFTVYPQAYSRHYHTKNALAELLGGPEPLTGRGRIAFDARLRSAGVAARFVTGTSYYDLCAHFPGARCVMINHASLPPVDSSGLSAVGKAGVLAYHFAGLSTVARKIANAWDKAARRFDRPTIELRSLRKVPQLNSLADVPRLEAELAEARGGEYHLAHLLLPHAPFSLDAGCKVKRPGSWVAERSDHPLAVRDAAYAEQSACAAQVVGRLVRAVERSPGAARAIILVHGDHGSRIVGAEPFGKDAAKANADDFRRGFSTLFAIRLPGQSGGRLVTGQWAVGELVERLAAARFAKLPDAPPSAPFVYIEDEDWRPIARRPLPDWNAAADRVRGPSQMRKKATTPAA